MRRTVAVAMAVLVFMVTPALAGKPEKPDYQAQIDELTARLEALEVEVASTQPTLKVYDANGAYIGPLVDSSPTIFNPPTGKFLELTWDLTTSAQTTLRYTYYTGFGCTGSTYTDALNSVNPNVIASRLFRGPGDGGLAWYTVDTQNVGYAWDFQCRRGADGLCQCPYIDPAEVPFPAVTKVEPDIPWPIQGPLSFQ